MPASGTEGNALTFGSFGSGDDPKIYGSFNWNQFTTGAESNILSNGSFETYTGTPDDGVKDVITGNDNGHIVTVADPNLSTIPDGDHALMLWDNGSNDQWRYRNVPVTAGQWYAIRFYGMSDGTGTVRLLIKQENGQGYYSTLDFSTTGYRMWDRWQPAAAYRDVVSNTDTDWAQKEYLFKVPDDFTGSAVYIRFENIANNSKAYVDKIEMYTPKWIESGSEYKIMTGSQEIDGMHYSDDGTNWTLMTEGTAGSLSSGEWDWDSSTGYLYARLPGGLPTDFQIEGAVRYWDVYADGKSYSTTDGLVLNFARTDGWHIQGAGAGNTIRSSTVQYNNNDGVNIHGSQTSVSIDSNSINYNGDGTTGMAAGDGVSFHDNCTGMIQNNHIEGNYKAQIDNIDASVVVSKYNYLEGRIPYTTGVSATGTHTVFNNIIIGDGSDSGIKLRNGTVSFLNNTAYGASSANGILTENGTLTVKNNIFENWGVGFNNDGGIITETYNNFYDNTTDSEGITLDVSDITSDPRLTAPGLSNFTLQYNSPAIDAGTNVGLNSDYAGNSIYGLPDIGAYEYQPPYDMGTEEVDIAANVRVYGDGKFRNTETAGGTTADLSVVPQGSQTTKWLDITKADDESAIIWEASHKKWKESSTTLGATNTLHTVGDLTVGKSYTLTIDGNPASEDPETGNIMSLNCADSICTADGTGKITFTYTGGYSEHTFDINDDIPPVITITSPETGDTVSGDDTITFTDSEQTDPECSVDNSAWLNCATTVTSFSNLTGWNDISESDTFTLYMRDTDASGNTGTASVTNLVKADTQAPVRSVGTPSGELASSTTSIALNLTTNESATCKYSTTSGTAFASMTESFTTSNRTTHSANISGLSSGNSYNYYVRCQDQSENANDTDYLISFSVASAQSDNDEDNERDLNIHKVKAISTENSITIIWKTDHNTKSTIKYGTNRNLKEKKKDSQKEKKHSVVLKDLLPNTKYYFRIKATDSDDNEDSSGIHSIITKTVSVPNANSNSTSNSNENSNQLSAPAENTVALSYFGNSTPNVCSYTVESGDTLWSIAKKVYGDATAYPLIIDKNKDKYTDIESKLSIGQELTFCDNSQAQQNSGNNSNQQTQSQSQNTQPQPETKTFHWWNPFSWF